MFPNRRFATALGNQWLPIIALRTATSVAFPQSKSPMFRGRAWAWGSDELNELSFIDLAADCVKNGTPVPIREHGHAMPMWSVDDVQKVRINHKPTKGLGDQVAYRLVKLMRWSFDTFSLYRFGKITERKVVNRCLYLETVAAVPGMVGGMLRHLRSLRRMKRDNGWIQTLLDEAENERMHLMTFMEMRQPGTFFRLCILATQAIMFNLLMVLYTISPKFVHRFVGYLEEEAVITYTSIMDHIDRGELRNLSKEVPEIAREYWSLPDNATLRDLMAVIRADEAEHRVVNHTFADMHANYLQDEPNPFAFLRIHQPPRIGLKE